MAHGLRHLAAARSDVARQLSATNCWSLSQQTERGPGGASAARQKLEENYLSLTGLSNYLPLLSSAARCHEILAREQRARHLCARFVISASAL